MPSYIFRAKDGPGKTVERELVAESEASAVARIEAMGLIPIWVRPKGRGHEAKSQPSQRGIRPSDVSVFTRQLASMLRSGVPILRALGTIGDQTENRRLQAVIGDMEAAIRDGSMLSEGMRRYKKLFPELYVNMVESGESGGVLDTILFRLAEAGDVEEENRRKVQAAMAYPVLVAVVGFVTVFVLLSFFMPRVMALFEGYQDLPLATQILLGVSGFFSRYWYWLVLGVGLVVVVFQRLAALDRGRTFVDSLKLRLPLVGHFLRNVDLARFARTFALLIDSGVSVDRVLKLSGNAIHNAVMRGEVEAVRARTVTHGMTLSASVKASACFPPFVGNMLAVGEETGRIDESLNEVARFYEGCVDRQSRMATSLIEPVLLLVVGLIVGFIVFAMLLPIFEIGSGLR
ncbi:MAG: type II secretion system F family protein [Verrucomicrobia bacterium]|jgi:type IV pilus assembly protein PilC|nr:type II secretion system F family protein [Verrucomicrobiota bacterium]